MSYSKYKRRFPDDILVCIEEFNKNDGTGLFDFVDSNEYRLFVTLLALESDLDRPSMVLVKNYNKRRVQENTIYSLRISVVRKWVDQILISFSNWDSFLIEYEIFLEGNEDEIFGSSVSLNDLFDVGLNYLMTSISDVSMYLFKSLHNIEAVIRDVGQGNWNEIASDGFIQVVYDAGAPMTASREEVLQRIGDRNERYRQSRPILILSHWDKDHYHSLLGMTTVQLRENFSAFLCRNFVPNRTSRVLFGRISDALGIECVYPIAADERVTGGGVPRFRNITPNESQIVLFNSQGHKNRNISGLVLTVKSARRSVVFSGDAHYEQISGDILPLLNYRHRHCLVAPHHGRRAGAYVYNRPSLVIFERSVISVGENRHGHPLDSYIGALRSDGFHVEQTRNVGRDIIIDL